MAIHLDSSAWEEADSAVGGITREIEAVLTEGRKTLEHTIRGEWPNPSNSTRHVSGRPSQATGTSSTANIVYWERDAGHYKLIHDITGRINPRTGQPATDYAEYVHFAGGETGDALQASKDEFARKVEAMRRRILNYVTKVIERHGRSAA